MPNHHSHPARRGTVLVMVLIIAVVITGLVMTLAWSAGIQSQTTAALTKLDTAFYAAESGAQRASWYIKKNQTVAQPLTGTLNGATYSVTWTTTGNVCRITSVATASGASSTLNVSVTRSDSTPVLATNGSIDLKNIDIIGNLQIQADISASGGTSTVAGNIVHGGTYTPDGHVTVSGDVTQASNSVADIDKAALTTAAAQVYNGNQSGRTFNFTALGGTTKVIVVNGNVTNPTFVGSGTLLVNGNIRITSNNATVGSAVSPVHLVATGSLDTANNFSMFGSVYADGDWVCRKITLSGLINVAGRLDRDTAPRSTVTLGNVPWFHPSSGAAGPASLSFANFAGPTP